MDTLRYYCRLLPTTRLFCYMRECKPRDVILQAAHADTCSRCSCAHNPTGIDPTHEQWKELSQIFKEKGHFPFFDMVRSDKAGGNDGGLCTAEKMFAISPHRPTKDSLLETSTMMPLRFDTLWPRVTSRSSPSRLPRTWDCTESEREPLASCVARPRKRLLVVVVVRKRGGTSWLKCGFSYAC